MKIPVIDKSEKPYKFFTELHIDRITYKLIKVVLTTEGIPLTIRGL